MAEELVCQGNNIVFKPFSEGFLAIQRLEAPVLSARASGTYTPIQDLESKQLLKNLLTSNDFRNLFERYTASVVYTTTFGMRIVTALTRQLGLRGQHGVAQQMRTSCAAFAMASASASRFRIRSVIVAASPSFRLITSE